MKFVSVPFRKEEIPKRQEKDWMETHMSVEEKIKHVLKNITLEDYLCFGC